MIMTTKRCEACVLTRADGACPFIEQTYVRGMALSREGTPADTIWFLQRGSVLVERDGGAKTIRRTGSFIGLEALVEPAYRDTARALDDVTACAAPVAEVDTWLGAPSTPARTALTQVLVSERDDAPRGAGADGSSLVRVARWLLDDVRRETPPPRHVLADLLGMVPETLSRALAELARRGAIEVTRRSVRVIDREELLAVAAH
jgi:CRP/FNR family transcriptional regulator